MVCIEGRSIQSPVKSLHEVLTKQHLKVCSLLLRLCKLYRTIIYQFTAIPYQLRTKCREMSEVLKGMIIAFFWCFHNYSFVARLVERLESTVRSFLKRASERGHIHYLPRSGRPSKLSRHDKRCIKCAWKRDHFQTKEVVCVRELSIGLIANASVLIS
ncbi:hypothetical protein HOY80DRAFT_887188 [Tuber brumale]|nr:hypothetical protein HOY80DRAFT_887188 [Tuber brumale]